MGYANQNMPYTASFFTSFAPIDSPASQVSTNGKLVKNGQYKVDFCSPSDALEFSHVLSIPLGPFPVVGPNMMVSFARSRTPNDHQRK